MTCEGYSFKCCSICRVIIDHISTTLVQSWLNDITPQSQPSTMVVITYPPYFFYQIITTFHLCPSPKKSPQHFMVSGVLSFNLSKKSKKLKDEKNILDVGSHVLPTKLICTPIYTAEKFSPIKRTAHILRVDFFYVFRYYEVGCCQMVVTF